jgi:hypothetical protein
VYQELVNNLLSPGLLQETRLTYADGILPSCWLKVIPIQMRFKSTPLTQRLALPTASFFTNEELEKIRGLVIAMGLDYGELDIVRDRDDGRVYVLDVNKTPAGNFVKLPQGELQKFRDAQAEALRQLIHKFAVSL